jgi:hypothetical protein
MNPFAFCLVFFYLGRFIGGVIIMSCILGWQASCLIYRGVAEGIVWIVRSLRGLRS